MAGCSLAPRLHPETGDGDAAGGRTHHLLGPWPNVTPTCLGNLGEETYWDSFDRSSMRNVCPLAETGDSAVSEGSDFVLRILIKINEGQHIYRALHVGSNLYS